MAQKIIPIHETSEAFEVYSHWDGGNISLTPVYFEQAGKRYFIVNTGPGDRESNLDYYVQQLSKNDGKYFCFYCYKPDIREFLDIVKSKGYHFVDDTKFDMHGDFVDFHGNMKEYSCAFMYRIYDMKMYEELKRELPKIKVRKL